MGTIGLAFPSSKGYCAGQGWGSRLKDIGGVRHESSKDLRAERRVAPFPRCGLGLAAFTWRLSPYTIVSFLKDEITLYLPGT